METEIFTYKINDFVGPIDLLLHLIEKNKIDIYDIPIATLTDEYISFIEANNKKDMETLSEFILMASTLIAIKSRMLLPRKENYEEEEDPRTDLVASLLEYKKIKEVVEILKTDFDGKIFTKDEQIELNDIINEMEEIQVDDVLKDVTLQKLYVVFKDLIDRNKKIEVKVKKSFSYVSPEKFKVSDKIKYINNFVKNNKKIKFIELFDVSARKNEKATTFLALLELIKSKTIIVEQTENFSEIFIKYNEEGSNLDE